MGIVFIIYVQQNKKKRNETGSKKGLEDDDEEEGELYAFIDRFTLLKHFRTFRDDETSRMIDQKCYHPFLHLR